MNFCGARLDTGTGCRRRVAAGRAACVAHEHVCSICQAFVRTRAAGVSLSCGHRFHRGCLGPWTLAGVQWAGRPDDPLYTSDDLDPRGAEPQPEPGPDADPDPDPDADPDPDPDLGRGYVSMWFRELGNSNSNPDPGAPRGTGPRAEAESDGHHLGMHAEENGGNADEMDDVPVTTDLLAPLVRLTAGCPNCRAPLVASEMSTFVAREDLENRMRYLLLLNSNMFVDLPLAPEVRAAVRAARGPDAQGDRGGAGEVMRLALPSVAVHPDALRALRAACDRRLDILGRLE